MAIRSAALTAGRRWRLVALCLKAGTAKKRLEAARRRAARLTADLPGRRTANRTASAHPNPDVDL